MDELAAVIAQGHIDVKVEEWINDHVVNTFQDDFIVDVEPEVTPRGRMSLAPRFALDKSEENSIAVDVFRLLLPDRATPAPKSRRQVVNRLVFDNLQRIASLLRSLCFLYVHAGRLRCVSTHPFVCFKFVRKV